MEKITDDLYIEPSGSSGVWLSTKNDRQRMFIPRDKVRRVIEVLAGHKDNLVVWLWWFFLETLAIIGLIPLVSGMSDTFLKFLINFTRWVIIPIIISSLLFLALRIANKASRTSVEAKVSSYSGFIGGLVLSTIYIVSQLNEVYGLVIKFDSLDLPSLQIVPLIAGIGSGFGIIWIASKTIPTRLGGLIPLILSAASVSFLFSYFFVSSASGFIIYLSLGFALGIFLYSMFFPTEVKELIF